MTNHTSNPWLLQFSNEYLILPRNPTLLPSKFILIFPRFLFIPTIQMLTPPSFWLVFPSTCFTISLFLNFLCGLTFMCLLKTAYSWIFKNSNLVIQFLAGTFTLIVVNIIFDLFLSLYLEFSINIYLPSLFLHFFSLSCFLLNW